MNIRFILSVLLIVFGCILFLLAGSNLIQSGIAASDDPPDEALRSFSKPVAELPEWFETSISNSGSSTLQNSDMISVVFLPADYGCSECIQRVSTYSDIFNSHEASQALSTEVYLIVIAPTMRIASHFSQVHQLEYSTFYSQRMPSVIEGNLSDTCNIFLIDTSSKTALMEISLNRVDPAIYESYISESLNDLYHRVSR